MMGMYQCTPKENPVTAELIQYKIVVHNVLQSYLNKLLLFYNATWLSPEKFGNRVVPIQKDRLGDASSVGN